MTTHRSPIVILVGAAAAAAVGIGLFVVLDLDSDETNRPVSVASGEDRFPSTSAADWVQYADYVVVATATAEEEDPPSAQEVALEAGLIGREVAFDVNNVLWVRHDDDLPPLGDSFTMPVIGWTFTDGASNRTELAIENTSRLEEGHRYVIALIARECRGTTGPTETWLTLGQGSVIPFDEAALGAGEFEGVDRTQDEVAEQLRAEPSLRQRVVGERPGSVADALARERPAAGGVDGSRLLARSCED